MLTIDETYLPITLFVPANTDEQFQALCEQYEDYRIEYTSDGELEIMLPTDPETGARNSSITYQLMRWALADPAGVVTDSSTGFRLPNGARLSPDAAWASRARLLQRLSCPEFVIELLSSSDRLNKARAKMQEWIDNGAELGWLIDPRTHTVTIYRPHREPEPRTGIDRLEGEGPVAGFVLDLAPVWRSL
ncbi:MAG: Uma2 family endonuclease [Bryobacteraceae bacterium]